MRALRPLIIDPVEKRWDQSDRKAQHDNDVDDAPAQPGHCPFYHLKLPDIIARQEIAFRFAFATVLWTKVEGIEPALQMFKLCA
jgi:hypothetical protein